MGYNILQILTKVKYFKIKISRKYKFFIKMIRLKIYISIFIDK